MLQNKLRVFWKLYPLMIDTLNNKYGVKVTHINGMEIL